MLLRSLLLLPLLASTSASPVWPQSPPAGTTPAPSKPADSSKFEYEQMDQLTLKGSNFSSRGTLLLEKASFPDFTRELWRMEWRSGDAIDLYIIKPAHAVKPPAILFLYSFPADTERFRNDEYCKTVTQHGVAAIGFVSALTGQRYHDRPWKQWFISELPEALVMTVHDVSMILDYLQTRTDIDTARVGMFGQGSGGTVALLAATAEPRLKAVDVLDPWGNWGEWFAHSSLLVDKERTYSADLTMQKKLTPLDPVNLRAPLAGRVLRLQQDDFDTITPAPARKQIADALGGDTELVRYRDLDDYKVRAAEQGKILAWLETKVAAYVTSEVSTH